jgi:glycosyltransferase involved in cell wall biosynthesis
MAHLSVVIPVFKAEKCLEELHARLTAALCTITEDYEVILVEDCGGDRSWEIICELSQRDKRVKGIQFSRNFGQHAATLCGISKANGEWIVTMDDDLEQSPEDISTLLQKAREGYSIVYGVYPQRTHTLWRNLTSELARRLFRLAIPSLNHEYTSFRVIEKNIAKAVCEFDSPFPFIDGYLSWLSNNYATVEVEHSARAQGTSNYNFRKLFTHTINIFVTFSDLPLKMASWVGLCSFMVGMVWLAIIVLSRLFGGIMVSGFSSLMAGIVLFGGIQMLILGIFGEYLGRMNFKSSKKPLFLIGQETGAMRRQKS